MEIGSEHVCTPPRRGGTDGARWTCPDCRAQYRFKHGTNGGALRQRLTGAWYLTKDGRS